MFKKILFAAFIISSTIFAQFGSQDSGGKLSPLQECYDIKFYDISITIDPNEKAIAGTVLMKAVTTTKVSKILVDLDQSYQINDVEVVSLDNKESALKYDHTDGKVLINFPVIMKKGEQFTTKISYAGLPRVAKRPPWDDGFIWGKNKDGKNWIAVTCQGGGADIWWPCKDHPSDKPDSVFLHYTVPNDGDCIATGDGVARLAVEAGRTVSYF